MKRFGGVHYVDVNGLRIAYRRAGIGPPLILLHGGFSDGREWSRQLAGLADTYSVYAWDAPGCGASDDPDEHTFRLPDYADTLAEVTRTLGLGLSAVVGLSFGSGLALQFYERHPDLVSALVLASPYAGWAGSLPDDEVRRRVRQVEHESTLPAGEFIPAWLPGLLTDAAPRELFDELVTIMSEFHPAGCRAMARSFAEADLRHVLDTIRVPVLVMSAELDVRSPPAVGKSMADQVPGGQFVVLNGVGHMSNMEAPDDFNRTLHEFLAANVGTT